MTALTNTEIDRKCAIEIMKWHEGKEPMHYLPCWNDKNDKCMKLQQDWHPSERLDQAHQIEDVLFKDETIWATYISKLMKICDPSNVNTGAIGLMVHATARQRCEACIQAWEDGK